MDIEEFMKTFREMEDALSKTVKISHRQVAALVVDDLVSKYRFNLERNDKEWADAFKKVLRYYLDERELAEVVAAAKDQQ